MTNARPKSGEIEAAIREAFSYGRSAIDDVAQILRVSRSTLERALNQPSHGCEPTDFTSMRREVRLEIALELLTRGKSAGSVAEKVCLSPDYLTVVAREETGLTPKQIIRAAQLGKKVAAWKREGPVAQGTALYRERLRKWERIDTEVTNLLGDLGPTHPLNAWAKKLVVGLQRPDYRRQPYRNQLQAKRRRESEEIQRRLTAYLKERKSRDPERLESELAGGGL